MSASTPLDLPSQKTFLKKLFAWYRKSGRHDMAWRKTKDPYRIMVSEFMLQQTTVATVGPYYDRFMRMFPNLKSLAESDLNDVLALWSGLGYYARARNLWAAAKMIHEEYKGKVPSEQADLRTLPGVGAYISGAVSTIAYNKPATVLDGNIIRVLMRVLGLEEDPKLKAVQILLQETSLDLNTLTKKNQKTPIQKKWEGPRNLSLALMDLGATVCTPRGPKCLICPLSDICLAKKFGHQDSIPQVAETLKRPVVRQLHAIVVHQGKWLMAQRPKEGLFGGLWEFFGVELPKGEEPVPYIEKAVLNETGLKIRVSESLSSFEHQLTHRIFIVKPVLAKIIGGKKAGTVVTQNKIYPKAKWVRPGDISRMGISSITKRIVNEVQGLKKRQAAE